MTDFSDSSWSKGAAVQKAGDVIQQEIKQEITRRAGWFRPFCLAVLVLILLTTCAVGGTVVLLVRQIITIPPGLLSAFSGGASPITIQATTVLESIQQMSELTTTRFNYSSLVTSERELPDILKGLYGDKLMMVAVGHVNAGIDLRQMTSGSISIDNGVMTIRLPAPQLLDCFLNVEASSIVSRDTGLFARPANNLDIEAQRYAVRQFRDMALKEDILSQVQTNSQIVITNFVKNLGVKEVKVITSPPDPNAQPPDKCR
jgi:hypothetical protein